MTTAEEKVNAVLMHHGIEGQKWGVRHGPPYPLDRKTSSKIKKGKEVTESKSSDDKKEYEDEFTKDFDEAVELIKSKNPDKSIDDIIFEKSLEELSDSMSYWWEGKPAINDFKQWDNFMSDKTYKDMEALHNKFNNVEVENDHGPSAEISMNGNKKTITFWPKEDWNFIVEKKMTKDDEKVLRDVINKYPYKKYEYGNPKFDSDNKLTGFESREEYTKRKEKERKSSDRKLLFSKEYWESRYASYLDRKEKKKLQHSALEYEIVDDVLEHYGVKGMKWGKHLKAKDYTVADYIKEHPEYADVLKMANKDAKISTGRLPKSREFTSMIGSGNERTTKQLVVPYVTDLMDELRSEAYEKSHPEEAEKIKSITGEKYTKSELDKLESDIKSGKASGELESVYLRKMNLYLQDDSVNKELKDFMKEKLFSDEKWYTTNVDYKNKNIVCSRVMDGKEETKKFKFPLSVNQSALAEEKVGLYLEHHGIFGMKWGVKHGPPYPLDRETSSKIKKSGKVKIDIRDLDDEDLRRIVQRLNLEKQLKELTKKDTEKSKSFASKTLEKFRDKTVDAVINMFTKSVESAGTKKLTALLNEKLNKESSE